MKKLVTLALCGAILLGGLNFWVSGNHTAAATVSPAAVHATPITFVPSGVVPTAARQAAKPPTRLSSYIPTIYWRP
ncbi:hypothetical protein [Ktedonobacter racemifer]|uniref:Uncharacterized protein n=1 Tax=Ktedonobacter racemifer DSM 44963 TaxID=485913 RepID=D6TVK1_KTERA|nr:hypothetical protein [Ktedonobacter racemifer]EFH85404.1 hypothetical protein Krac_6624 [Ktedonobacter racemifer DSM 44963]